MMDRRRSADEAQSVPAPDPPRLARPLVLVGLMGAGKTSVGKRLAALVLPAPINPTSTSERASRIGGRAACPSGWSSAGLGWSIMPIAVGPR